MMAHGDSLRRWNAVPENRARVRQRMTIRNPGAKGRTALIVKLYGRELSPEERVAMRKLRSAGVPLLERRALVEQWGMKA